MAAKKSMMVFWGRCQKAAYALLFAVLIPISAYIFYGALDTLKYADALSGFVQGKMVPVCMLGVSFTLGILFVWAAGKLVPFLEKRQKPLFVLVAMMLLLQICMVLGIRTSLRHDHLKIFDTAAALLQEGTIADTHFKQYFMKYPNNIPLCLFTYFFLKAASVLGIPKEHWMEFIKLVNLLFMDLGLWCSFRLVCRYRSKRTGLFFLLFLMANPLWYLLGQMYYTSTISLAFSMGALQMFSLAGRQGNKWKKYMAYAAMGFLLAVGYKLRATVILTAAAAAAFAVLSMEKTKLRQGVFGFAAALAGTVLVFGVYGQAEKQYAGFDPSQTGYPIVHWVMMSAQGEGQYNSADDAYTGSFSTKEEKKKADTALLAQRVRQMGLGGLLHLFRNKLRVVFSDGTDDYYALFRSMREASGFQKYINGGRSDYLAVYLHGYHGVLTGFFLFSCILHAMRGKKDLLDTVGFNICGAYLFYLVWEADNAYSIPFMLLFLVWAAEAAEVLSDGFCRMQKRRAFLRCLPKVAGAGIALLSVGLVAAVRQAGLPVREYSVLQEQETSKDLTLQTEFTQTFRTGKAFDHVDLKVANWDGAANDSVYDLRIVDSGGKDVAAGEIIGALAPCMEAYTVAFEKVIPEKEDIYRLQVRLRNPDCAIKTDFLYYQSGTWDIYSEGALYAPEEVADADLAFSVYEER